MINGEFARKSCFMRNGEKQRHVDEIPTCLCFFLRRDPRKNAGYVEIGSKL